MAFSSTESQQTQAFSIDHENVLPEHYRLIELIGRGGMAEVYLAEDKRLGRKVAIKFLNPEFRRDPDRVRRFRQEARSASALNHPNILIIHDIGDGGGVQFIVSEFVEGETLGTRIAQGKVSSSETVEIAIQAASALTAAHAAGIVHRDIKPDNVMIRNDGVVKVLDFGLAKSSGFVSANGSDFDATTIDSGSTSPGLIVGTPQYMSPEQARGKELDGRTDIFSLGIIIFEMVTRHSPFAAATFADTMAAILTKEPRKFEEFVEGVPARLVSLVDKCLKKNREERFASMAEVGLELKALKGEIVNSPRITKEFDAAKSDRTQIRRTHQHSIRAFVSNTFQKPSPIAAVIILAVAGLLAGGWWALDRSSAGGSTPALMKTVPITSWSSTSSEGVMSATFSPDEKMIAYEVRRGDSTHIWVKPVVGGDPVQVTKDGGVNAFPIWSPDGDELAFYSNRGNRPGIWRVPFTGGPTSLIVPDVRDAARPVLWTRDGNIIFQQSNGTQQELHRFNAANGKDTQLGGLGDLDARVWTLEISPDEHSVVYSIKEGSGWSLRVKDLAGGTDKLIAETRDQIDHLAWHPNGESVFASFSVEGVLQVFEAKMDGSGAQQRSNGDMNYVVHDVSKSGSVLYGSLSETSDLWRINTADAAESVVSNAVPSEFWPDVNRDGSIAFQSVARVERPERGGLLVASGRATREVTDVSPSGFSPSWSHSGELIAFYRRDDKDLSVWISRANGVDLVKLKAADVASPEYSLAPYLKIAAKDLVWSPDDSIVASSIRINGKVKLWLASSYASQDGRLLDPDMSGGMTERDPVWIGDGSIVYSSVDRTGSGGLVYRIQRIDPGTGEKDLLFESEEPLRVLGMENSRRTLLFARKKEKSYLPPAPPVTDLYRLALATGQTTKFRSLNNAFFSNIHLADDGKSLAYVSRERDLTTIAISSINGDSTKDLLVINDPKVMISSLALSPNGDFIVYGKQTRTNLLSMLTK